MRRTQDGASWPIDRRRLVTIVAMMFGGYLAALVLLGLAAGFGAHWLVAATIGALAFGMSASVFIRIWLLALNPGGREQWWGKVSHGGRLARVGLLAFRTALVCYCWYLTAATALSLSVWPRLP